MNFVKSVPLFFFVLLLYTSLALVEAQGAFSLYDTIIYIPFPGDAALFLSSEDLVILLGLVCLFVEIIKATSVSNQSIREHIFSTFVLIGFLGEFFLIPHLVARPAFLFLTIMALVDVVAGFTVSITAARKDFNISS